MHHVDVEFKNGNRISPQFATQGEAVAYAGRTAQDGRVMRSEVRGLDAKVTYKVYGKGENAVGVLSGGPPEPISIYIWLEGASSARVKKFPATKRADAISFFSDLKSSRQYEGKKVVLAETWDGKQHREFGRR